MTTTILSSNFRFRDKKHLQRKVRDVYNIADKYLLMIVSDRISAFVVLQKNPIKDRS
jgi:phosphoribosylaminoimidazole-succinocarboxamide synthase